MTNDDVAAKLVVIKHVVNDNGGTAVAANFTMTVDDPGTNPPSFPGAEAPGTDVAVDPGAYSVSESGPSGTRRRMSADCAGTIAIGQTKTCTVTNNDVQPSLIVDQARDQRRGRDGGRGRLHDERDRAERNAGLVPRHGGARDAGRAERRRVQRLRGGDGGLRRGSSADCAGTIAVGQTKTCTITNNDDVAPTVEVVKTANPTSVPETAPGATQNVVFTYTIYNRSAEPLKITQFVDDKFDLATKCPGIVGLTLAKDDGNDASGLDQVTCNFAVGLSGNAGSTHTNVVNVTGEDDEGDEATDSDDAVVTFTNTPSAIAVIKTANPTSMQEPGGTVTFHRVGAEQLGNRHRDDHVAGRLDPRQPERPGHVLRPADDPAGRDVHVHLHGQRVQDRDGRRHGERHGRRREPRVGRRRRDGDGHGDAADAVDPETMDVAIVKDATAQVTLGSDGTAVIDYEARVRNNGPNQAHNVTLADPSPSGVTFLSITQQPSQEQLHLGRVAPECNFGTLGPGVQVTVRWNARVSVTGSVRNVGTATGQGTDTNGANNTDDAVTVVVAPLIPPPPAPKPKPKPKPAAQVCRTLSVGPKLLRATGQRQLVTIKVVEGKKPAKGVRVRITGPGINRTVTTNAKGLVRVTLRPSKAGILRFTITNARACNTQRIGVVGVFEPRSRARGGERRGDERDGREVVPLAFVMRALTSIGLVALLVAAVLAPGAGAGGGVTTSGLRPVARVQVVGAGPIAWGGSASGRARAGTPAWSRRLPSFGRTSGSATCSRSRRSATRTASRCGTASRCPAARTAARAGSRPPRPRWLRSTAGW